jgi:hypothetical protein
MRRGFAGNEIPPFSTGSSEEDFGDDGTEVGYGESSSASQGRAA